MPVFILDIISSYNNPQGGGGEGGGGGLISGVLREPYKINKIVLYITCYLR